MGSVLSIVFVLGLVKKIKFSYHVFLESCLTYFGTYCSWDFEHGKNIISSLLCIFGSQHKHPLDGLTIYNEG